MTPADAQAFALNHIFGVEGGDADDEADRGGRTRYGITAAVAAKHGLDVTRITREQARRIYVKDYLEPLRFLSIAQYLPRFAIELADAAVNCGTPTAGIWLQTALNALNYDNQYGADLAVDGKVGPATVTMLQRFAIHRGKFLGQKVLIAALEGQQASRYLTLASKDKSQRKFYYGWISNRIIDEAPSA